MFRKLFLLAITLCSVSLFSQINTGSPTVPFGSNTSYEYGIMPTNLPSGGTYGPGTDVAAAYNTWKSTYVENCGSDKARVKFDNTSETVSEGIAYGMLIAAYAADKDLFDRLWAYYKQHRNTNGVMHWRISGCNSVVGQNGATDAELDAAMALIVAHHQWPNSTSPHNYQTDGVALITAIKDWEVSTSDGTFYNGDVWHPNCRNPSYQAPAYARAFKLFTNDSSWDNVAAGTENLFKNNAHATSGLSTNWCLPSGVPSGSCSGSGTSPDKFGYDACRAPWRQGVDVIWWGPSATGDVQTIINRQASFWTNKGGATTVQGSNNLNHDGSGSGDHNGAFTGMIGGMSLGASSSHQNFCNDLYTENLKSSMDNGYFTGILRIIGLFVQTGNFWNPYATTSGGTNVDPTVSLTAPSNGLSVCEGVSISFTANASDSDGNIDKVQFFEGANLLKTDNSAPYSYNWTNATVGTKTLTAVAYDDKGASTTSSSVSITIKASPTAPTGTTSYNYCLNESAQQLQASGQNLKWYTQATGNNSSGNAPTPSTSSAGTTSYYVSQTMNGCESERTEIQVTVSQTVNPTVTSPINYCQGEQASQLQATGQGLKWYTQASGGGSSNSAPTPSTNDVGTVSYYVSQTVSGCESQREEIEVNTGEATDAPVAITPSDYCQYETANALSATGQNLLWYTSSTGGNGIPSLTPNINDAGNTTYYVSQTVNGCESARTGVVVTVNERPEEPTVTSQVVYTVNSVANQLEASGTNLQWYTQSTGGGGSVTAPTPTTSSEGTTSYYVSQTIGNCESGRAEIEIVVTDALVVEKTPTAPVIDGQVDGIWAVVEGVQYTNVINGTISNAADLSGTFKLLWDDNNFYVLGEIVDDNLRNDSPQRYKDDAPEVFFDFGNDKASTYGNDDAQYTFRWNDNTPESNNGSVNGIVFDMVATNNGYTFEARFPWSLLGGTGVVGDLHGFEFEVNDDDDGGDRDGKMAWKATTDDAWKDPSLFGTIILGEEIELCTKPTTAQITNGTSLAFCQGGQETLVATNVSGALYRWYKNGQVINNQTSNQLTVSTAGDYHVRIADNLIDDASCYLESNVTTVSVTATPVATISSSKNAYCEGESGVTLEAGSVNGGMYTWTGAVTSSNSVIQNATQGTYVLTVSINGCESEPTSITVTEKPLPNATIVGESSFCEGSAGTTLEAQTVNGASYSWSGTATANTQTLLVTTGGSFTLTVTLDGCEATAQQTVNQMNRPVPSIVGAAKACIYNSTELYEYTVNGGGNSTYQWFVGNAAIVSGEFAKDMKVEFSTGNGATVGVVETNASGCESELLELSVEYDCPNGTNEEELNNRSVFPNPFYDAIFVEDFTTYEIYDLSGRIVLEGFVEAGVIKTESLQKAVYVVKLNSELGVKVLKMNKE